MDGTQSSIPPEHRENAARWTREQLWETRIMRTKAGPLPNPVWVKIPRGFEPCWDAYQEYREVKE